MSNELLKYDILKNNKNFKLENYDKTNTRVGERIVNYKGDEIVIVGYNNYRDVLVKSTNTGEIIKTTYENFKKKIIKSHFSPSVLGVGITGLEKTRNEDETIIKEYNIWKGMLRRCYYKDFLDKYKTYEKCFVCNDWLYYPNFRNWYKDNYYEIDGEIMCLDKDILIKGNKIYSPDTCVIVPQKINATFVKKDKNRGEFPIGVSTDDNSREKKYTSNVSIGKGRSAKKIGRFKTPEEAFYAYKTFKENYIKELAEEYRDKIPKILYDALHRYEVEITD